MGSYKINTNGKLNCFMKAPDGNLLLGSDEGAGVVQTVHRVRAQNMPDGDLHIEGGAIIKRKAHTPLFERIVLQLREIVNKCAKNSEEEDRIQGMLVELAFDLSKAEEDVLVYLNLYNDAVSIIESTGGVEEQRSGLNYDDPTNDLQNIAKRVIIQYVIALRKMPALLTTLLGTQIRGGKYFFSDLISSLPPDHPAIKALREDETWIKELFDIRGMVEHHRWEVEPFRIVGNLEGPSKYTGTDCVTFLESQGKTVFLYNYLAILFDNIVTFIEETVVTVVGINLPPLFRLVEYPEEIRHEHEHFRYKVGLRQDIEDKIAKKEQDT